MLMNLIKYDLKYMFKNMLPFYVLAILFSVFYRVCISLEQTTFINILGQICVGTMFSMVASTLMNTIIRGWIRFSTTLYKDESYLYHTLPVNRTTLYESKFIQILIFSLVNFVVIIISLLITFASKDNIELLKLTLEQVTNTTSLNMKILIVLFIIMIFFEIFVIVQSGFAGMIMANKINRRKKLLTFVFGFAVYGISISVVVIAILILGLFNGNIMSIFTDNNVILTNSDVTLLLVYGIGVYALVNVAINIVSVKLFNGVLNIE